MIKHLAIIACLIAASSGAAMACSPPAIHGLPADIRQSARDALEQARVVADVEAMRELPGTTRGAPAVMRMRVLRVWKGPRMDMVDVAARNTCDIGFWMAHGRYRLLLDGGPVVYAAPMPLNGLFSADASRFGREIDRLLHDLRPPTFAQAGLMPAPSPLVR